MILKKGSKFDICYPFLNKAVSISSKVNAIIHFYKLWIKAK